MGKDTTIIGMPGWELSEKIHAREVSCKEVMETFLDHIDRVNPKVNAIVARQDRGGLLRQAEEKDKTLASGKSDGWMHGFPQAIKDFENNKGIPSTCGSLILKDNIPTEDALMTSRIKAAGGILVGRTNVPEYALGSHTYNKVYGVTGNPYNPGISAGGSSGGAACALALGMLPVADGSDFMGSLRNPAGWCNVYSMRPTYGLVPSGVELFMNSFSCKGSMGRNVPDIALLMGTISGYDESIPFSLSEDADIKGLTTKNVHERLTADHKGKKIGWLGDWDGYLPMENGVLAVCERALKSFGQLGVSVEKAAPPMDGQKFWDEIWLPLRHFSQYGQKANCEDPEKRKLLKSEVIFEYEGSAKYTGRDIYAASMKRSDFYRTVLKMFAVYDYLAVPTAQVFAFDCSWDWPKEIAGKKMDTYHRWMEVVAAWTMASTPVVSIPAGCNEQGKFMGIQLIGKPRTDFDLLQMAYAYDQVTDVIRANPPRLMHE